MVQTIQKITQQSKSLTTVAEALNPMNGVPLLGPSSGSGSSSFNDVINGFQGIIQTGTTAITNMQGTPSYTDTAAEEQVCDAFHEVSRALSLTISRIDSFAVCRGPPKPA
jgi:ABC-type polar amino acid transport system ATPase subunit